MRLVPPVTVDSSNLTSSNVPDTPPTAYDVGTTYDTGDRASVLQADGYTWKVYESIVDSNTGNAVTDTGYWRYLADTYAEYDAGTTYAVDDIVISLTTNKAYQALVDGESGNSLSNTAKWLDLGPTNRYKMFDNSNTSQTLNGADVDVEFDVTGRVNAVSVLNMVAATVQLIMSTDADGEIYNETINLVSSANVTDWWEYFFLPVTRYGDWTFTDLPTNNNPTIQVIVSDPDGIAKVGTVAAGLSINIGDVIYPSSIGIQDYSRKEADEFGYFTIIQRSFAKRASFKISAVEANVDGVTTALADIRATPVVFVGVEQYRATWIYGFYKDWSYQFAGPNEAYINLEIEGLT